MVTVSRKDGVVQREVAGEVFLVPIRGHLVDMQELFVLNETGRWIWERLEGAFSLADLMSGMVAEFEVDEATASRDIEGFVGNLVEAGLAQTAGGEV
jgi:hypothetical protein